MSIASELSRIQTAKANLKTAIESKGVVVGEGSIETYPDKIASIESNTWTAPSDWIDIGSPSNNEILLLVSDYIPTVAFTVFVTGGSTVDWGDGTVSNYASGADAIHTYTVGAGQPCSEGYSTFKIRIYSQIQSNQITRFMVINSGYSSVSSILVAKLGTTGLTSLQNAFYINTYSLPHHLRWVELPESLPSCTNFENSFNEAISLKKIKMPLTYSTSYSSWYRTFFNCHSLMEIDYRGEIIYVSDYWGFGDVHNFNYSLKKCILPSKIYFNNSSTLSSWTECASLEEIHLPEINKTTVLQGFSKCKSLKTITFHPSWNVYFSHIHDFNDPKVNISSISLPLNASGSGFQQYNFPKVKSLRLPTFTNGLSNGFADYGFISSNLALEELNNFPNLSNQTIGTDYFFSGMKRLKKITDTSGNPYYFATFGDTTTGMNRAGTWSNCISLERIDCCNKITGRFVLSGGSSLFPAKLSSLLFINPQAVSTWAGYSPQIDIAYCSLNASALNALFTSIIATSASFSGKTIRITGNPGASTCDTTIITNAGGTVNKTT